MVIGGPDLIGSITLCVGDSLYVATSSRHDIDYRVVACVITERAEGDHLAIGGELRIVVVALAVAQVDLFTRGHVKLEDLPQTIIVALVDDLLAIGRPERIDLIAGAVGQALFGASRYVDHVQVAGT